mmetsp:Transcript_12908/g.40950  ORF Transcript_12908/g.40950 Transcript_12908/m.40950 type:complete len:338 (+) Transcript_12908:30-1043(+)
MPEERLGAATLRPLELAGALGGRRAGLGEWRLGDAVKAAVPVVSEFLVGEDAGAVGREGPEGAEGEGLGRPSVEEGDSGVEGGVGPIVEVEGEEVWSGDEDLGDDGTEDLGEAGSAGEGGDRRGEDEGAGHGEDVAEEEERERGGWDRGGGGAEAAGEGGVFGEARGGVERGRSGERRDLAPLAGVGGPGRGAVGGAVGQRVHEERPAALEGEREARRIAEEAGLDAAGHGASHRRARRRGSHHRHVDGRDERRRQGRRAERGHPVARQGDAQLASPRAAFVERGHRPRARHREAQRDHQPARRRPHPRAEPPRQPPLVLLRAAARSAGVTAERFLR